MNSEIILKIFYVYVCTPKYMHVQDSMEVRGGHHLPYGVNEVLGWCRKLSPGGLEEEEVP